MSRLKMNQGDGDLKERLQVEDCMVARKGGEEEGGKRRVFCIKR